MSNQAGVSGRQSGRIFFGSDFVGANGSAAVLGPDIEAFGVGTETYAATVDESGGILALGTGSTDDDNAVIRSGPFAPRDGKMILRTRFKYSNAAEGPTDAFRAVYGDAGAARSDSSNGIRATATLTADRWFEVEIVLNED